MVTILCGKSGSGKDCLCNMLTQDENFEKIVSTTTRPIREGEIKGVSYYFIDKDTFLKKVKEGSIIEYRPYSTLLNGNRDTWYYGTSKEALLNLDKNKDYVLIKDLEGAKAIQNFFGKENVFIAYIDVPDEQRTQWAKSRGSFDEEEWNRRLADDNEKFNIKRIGTLCNIFIRNDHTPEILKLEFLNALQNYKENIKLSKEDDFIIEDR